MTLEQAESAPLRTKPPVRRRPSPAPRKPQPETNGDVVDVATMARQLEAMQARIDELESGKMRTVASAPANTVGPSRVAANEELTPWQLRVRERTEPTPTNLDRSERSYNYSPKLFMKPDGSVVELQGDPQNFSYYTTKKKFHALTDAEVREYLTHERPKIVRLQQEKAGLINTIRRAIAVDPALTAGLDPNWERDLDRMNIAELQAQLDEIAGVPTSTGAKRRIMKRLPRLQDADDAAAEDEMRRMLAGVETSPTRTAVDALEGSLPNIPQPRSRTREIEITQKNARSFA